MSGGPRRRVPGRRSALSRLASLPARLRVATWNVHAFVGTDGRRDVERAGEVIAGIRADVIGLQEVDERPAADGRRPLEVLASRLDMEVLEGPNLEDHRGRYGNALLSRHPIRDAERVDLSVPGREPRGAIDARIEGVRVIVTHLGLAARERRTQLSMLRARLACADPSEPVVVLGDLNEWRPWPGAGLRLVPAPLPYVSRARTWPSPLPALALDRILARPAPRERVVRVCRDPLARRASDHLPLVADLGW